MTIQIINRKDLIKTVFLTLSLLLIFLNGISPMECSLQAAQAQNEGGVAQDEKWSVPRVHAMIKEKNPTYKNEAQCVVEEGELIALDLSAADLADFSFLRAMTTLSILDMRGTSIRDLSMLLGLPLTVLGCEETGISDLSPLKGMKLEKLYLNNTKVEDLKPLTGMPLELLELIGTAVEDLKPIAKTKTLRRLHIAESGVTVLTPIRDLELTRLVFTPRDIEKGLEIVRNMKSIQEIGIKLDSLLPPAMFWSLYDQGMYD